MSKTMYDVMVCPKCNSEDVYAHSTDEIDFEDDGNGHYFVDCRCRECESGFRLYTFFKYEVVRSYARQ